MIIEAKDITYAYKSQKDKIILNHISVPFEEGTFYAIVGASGSGKTTFLSLLAGLDRPTSGTILCHGKNIQDTGLYDHRRHNISLVFQNYNLIDYLTAEENVRLGGGRQKPAHGSRSEAYTTSRTNNAKALLEKVSIPKEAWKRNVLQLSGGQQQRVAIARALASSAKILLADEPTGNLDEDTAVEIIRLLQQTAHESGKCVIVVTHSQQLAREADQVLELDHGKLKYRENS
ncbi:MAG TPA: ABC transporter ATP-binding protein [Candidatus Scybalocola faecavium]|nr:ABC transporter ATP-binding protein [Candidatus Scybalocola faecavium]